jgi:hypothetical protein
LEACDLVTKFERERYFVEALAKILPLSVDQYRDPFDDYARETGVDVIAVVGSRQIGFQVTEYDGGEGNSQMKPGHMRATEVGGETRSRRYGCLRRLGFTARRAGLFG